jgi:DNA-binding SARP family transcriptional activator
MEFRLLGPLEVRAGDGPVPLGAPKQRALLAFLLLHANRVVAQERLIDEVWGESPPVTAAKSVQHYVSRLRKVLPAGTLVTQRPGYLLEVEPDTLDVARFERLVDESQSAEPARAATLLREALGLWRGPPLAELRDEPFARLEAERLENVRLAALEQRIEADLALGRHGQLVGELETLVREHPHRERLRGQLMLALYRAGRQADALEAYRDARDALDELGLEPGAALRRLERQVLTQDAVLDPGSFPAALPGPLVPASPFPFVGRSRELDELRALLERAEGGEGSFVLLAAEAGGGKTRLVRELAQEAAARSALVLYGVADAVVTTPHQPLREWLESLLRACDEKTLAGSLGAGSEVLARLVPELQRLTGPPPPTGTPADDRYLLQLAAIELLRRLGRSRPLLLVAEDVHWADGETLHLLRRLARSAPEERLLVVASHRAEDGEIGPAFSEMLADLSRAESIVRLSLGRLSADDVGAFIRAATDVEAPAELASALGELTGGTPLLLCELWRELRDEGALEVSGGGLRLRRPPAELRGPERLRDIVRQRLARLGPETAATLELAAAAGPRFELGVLGEAAAVRDAVATGLVEELPESVPAARFTHELVRRAIYDRIPVIARAELHLRVGEALERLHRTDLARVVAELAHHFTLAAPVAGVERAVDYNLRAADAALAAAATDEGAARLSTALELGIADPRERARTQIELAHLLHQLGRGPEAEAMLARSLDAATGLEERGVAARALVQRIGMRIGDSALDLEDGRKVAEAAIETLEQVGSARDLAVARRYHGLVLQGLGRCGESVPVLERALVDADESGDRLIRRRVVGALVHSICGGPTPVTQGMNRAEELLRSSTGDRMLTAILERFLAFHYAMAGRFDDARDALRTSSPVLDDVRNDTIVWTYRWTAALARELVGDDAGAEHELRGRWRSFDELGEQATDDRAMQSAYLLALLYCDRGRWDDAEECLAYGRSVPTNRLHTAAFRLAAEARLAARRGRQAEALELARGGVASAERGDNLNFRARTWLALAEVQRARGAAEEAEAAVAEAIRLYEAKGNLAAVARLGDPGAVTTGS